MFIQKKLNKKKNIRIIGPLIWGGIQYRNKDKTNILHISLFLRLFINNYILEIKLNIYDKKIIEIYFILIMFLGL